MEIEAVNYYNQEPRFQGRVKKSITFTQGAGTSVVADICNRYFTELEIFKKLIWPYYKKKFRSISGTFANAFLDTTIEPYNVEKGGWYIPDDLSYAVSDNIFGGSINFNFVDFPHRDWFSDFFVNIGNGSSVRLRFK